MGAVAKPEICKHIFVRRKQSVLSVRRHFWLLPTDFSKEIKIFLLGNGCFNYQTTSVISVNSVHSVQKTQLKCVFCMQVLQQPLVICLDIIQFENHFFYLFSNLPLDIISLLCYCKKEKSNRLTMYFT